MRLLLVILSLALLFSLSSCYDVERKSLERSADYQEQQVEQLKRIADQLERINYQNDNAVFGIHYY